MQEIQWYPGHMVKAKRQLAELIKYLDVLIEIRDARLPFISHNNDLDDLLERRPNLIILTKSDLADPVQTRQWLQWFASQGKPALEVNGKNGQGVQTIWSMLTKQFADRKVKLMIKAGVVGIPNVGKSSILNRLLGRAAAKTGNLPGITRGKQWVRRNEFEILDTPGLLPPKFTTQEDALKLALIGTIREEIVPTYDLALELLDKYSSKLSLLNLGDEQSMSPEEKLACFAVKRGFLIKGGEIDHNRAITTLLKEFRDGRFGRITLENPPH